MRIALISLSALIMAGSATAQAPPPMAAAPAGNDQNKPLELKGETAGLDTSGARAVLTLKTPDAKTWKVDVGASERVRGMMPAMADRLADGTPLTVRAFAANSEPMVAAAQELIWSDGRRARAPIGGPPGPPRSGL